MKNIKLNNKQLADLKDLDFEQIKSRIKQYHESHVIAVNQNVLREKPDRTVSYMASGSFCWGGDKPGYEYEDLVIRLHELKKFIEAVTK